MTTYLRESDRLDSGLPSIRPRSGLVDGYPARPSRITAFDDPLSDDRHVRFSTSSGMYRDSRERDRERDNGSPLFYPRPPSPSRDGGRRPFSPTRESRRQMLDLQDEVTLYREELSKKDRLISQLSSLDTPRGKTFETTKLDDLYSSDRMAATAAARSEVAALQVRVDGLQSELRECRVQMDIREEKIRELKLELETTRESEVKQASLVQTLRQQMVQYEATAGSLEGAASRSEVVARTLQSEKESAHKRILDLEGRLRTHLEERENLEQQMVEYERRYKDLYHSCSSVMCVDDISPESMVSRLTETVQENAVLKGKLMTMKEHLQSAEVEHKASRETIMRLVSEAEREQKYANKYTMEMDSLRLERDRAVAQQRDLEREIDSMKERLEASQRAWSATRKELEDRESRFSGLDRAARDNEQIARQSELSLKTFRDQLATILSDGDYAVEPYEDSIRDRIKMLLLSSRDHRAHVDMLEAKVSTLTEQLDRNYELQRTGDHRAKRVEADCLELEQRLRRAEEELSAADLLRDGLRSHKERHMRFLEQLSQVLRMDPITADMGYDMAVDAVLARAEQISRMENDTLEDRKTHIYNLQRKIKSQKEQLDSKDLHMELLRKKLAGLEERLAGKSELEREKDSEFVKNRKLIKLVEKYKLELQEYKMQLTDLKSRLLESSDIKNRAFEQEREIENLESKVGQLEHVRQKQAGKIANLKDEVEIRSQEDLSKRSSVNQTIHALSSELRTTKSALDEITKRERQLLDLRQVVARMLGLDVNALAVPDYEIIARLEKLILAQHSGAISTATIDSAIADMENSFRSGYESAGHSFKLRPRSPTRKTTLRTRARSLSPTRKKDSRAY